MNMPCPDAFSASRDWLDAARDELLTLIADITGVVSAVYAKWATDQAFRAQVIAKLMSIVGVMAMRGPRASVLWAVQLVAQVVAHIARYLDQSRPGSATAY